MFKPKSFFLITSCFISGLLIVFLFSAIWRAKNNTSSPNTAEVTEKQTNTIKFTSQISPIPPQMKEKMIGVTWKVQCPITLDKSPIMVYRL